MGVKGLFQFLKRFEKDVNIPQFVSGKSVGIDIFWFLHQSKGDMFHLQNNLLQIITHSEKVICVFDGSPSKEKKEYLCTLVEKRQQLRDSIDAIEKFLKYPFNRLTTVDKGVLIEYVNQLKRQAWQPPIEYIDYVKNWLTNKKCEIHQAFGEADEYLVNLQQKGRIDTIITNDSDLLVLGATNVIRLYNPFRGGLYECAHLCKSLDFTEQQWSDFMYLCRNMKDNDVQFAYSLISVYKDLDYIFQKYNLNLDIQNFQST
jgi:5'-3' exonuclease